MDVFQTVEVVIEGRPPSLNSRRHWQQVARDNALWKEAAAVTALAALGDWAHRHGKPWEALRECDLHVAFVVSSTGRRDWDNLVSTLKPLMDGIVAAGVIVDDSTACIESIRLRLDYEKGRSATALTFTEVR